MVVNSRVSHLRKTLRRRGEGIVCEKLPGIDGSRGYGYRLVSLPTPAVPGLNTPAAGVGSEDAELALGVGGAAGGRDPQLPVTSPAPPVNEALPPPVQEPEQFPMEAA
jgi:hypothetical protein